MRKKSKSEIPSIDKLALDGAEMIELDDLLDESELVALTIADKEFDKAQAQLRQAAAEEMKDRITRQIRRGIRPTATPDEIEEVGLTKWFGELIANHEQAARFANTGLGRMLTEDD